LAILIKDKVHEALLKEGVIIIQGIIVKQGALKVGYKIKLEFDQQDQTYKLII